MFNTLQVNEHLLVKCLTSKGKSCWKVGSQGTYNIRETIPRWLHSGAWRGHGTQPHQDVRTRTAASNRGCAGRVASFSSEAKRGWWSVNPGLHRGHIPNGFLVLSIGECSRVYGMGLHSYLWAAIMDHHGIPR